MLVLCAGPGARRPPPRAAEMHAMCSETGRGVLPMVAEMPAMCSGTERGAPTAAEMHVTYSGTVLAALMAVAAAAGMPVTCSGTERGGLLLTAVAAAAAAMYVTCSGTGRAGDELVVCCVDFSSAVFFGHGAKYKSLPQTSLELSTQTQLPAPIA